MRIAIAILILLSGCKSLQKSIEAVKNNSAATDEVVADYVKKHPPKNDTTYIKGETIVKDSLRIDTIPMPVPVPYKIVEKHYKETSQVDTSKITDRKFVEALSRRISVLEEKLIRTEAENKELKGELMKYKFLFFGLLAVLLGGSVLYVIKVLKPSVTIQRP